MPARTWLNRIWYLDAAPPPWLLPLATLFGVLSRLRRWLYVKNIRASVHLSRPVVVIGNLSVGGTGKTPLACWLVERLKERGYTPGVVTRGYGGSNRRARLVRETDDPGLVGDEPLLLARSTHAAVAVGRDRPAAAQILVGAGCDIIVSDDGLQHYALARDCEIVVVDAERGHGNGRLLPAGPLRESTSRLATVDAIVVNGAGGGWLRFDSPDRAGGCGPAIFGLRLNAAYAVSLLGAASRDLNEFAGVAVHAVAGIGNPQRFFATLRAFGMHVSAHEFPDHAALKATDIEFGDDRPVLMTEKDAVKCAGFAGALHWYVPVNVSFDFDGAEQLLGIVTRSITARS